MSAKAFTKELVAAFAPLADAERAVGMRAYMRERFAFLGIPMPARRTAALPLIKAQKGAEADELLAIARALWQMEAREYHYTAVDLLARHWRTLSAEHLDDLLALARTNSWWDSVDALAGVVGDILHVSPAREIARMDAALLDGDFWIRRIAMLHQLGWRADTDEARLFDYALRLAPETEFFIRKAIGWALRDYAWHAPAVVAHFLGTHGEALSPLTRREAAKNLAKLIQD